MKNNCPVLSGSWIERVGRVASLLRPPFNLFALSLIACLATALLVRFLRLRTPPWGVWQHSHLWGNYCDMEVIEPPCSFDRNIQEE